MRCIFCVGAGQRTRDVGQEEEIKQLTQLLQGLERNGGISGPVHRQSRLGFFLIWKTPGRRCGQLGRPSPQRLPAGGLHNFRCKTPGNFCEVPADPIFLGSLVTPRGSQKEALPRPGQTALNTARTGPTVPNTARTMGPGSFPSAHNLAFDQALT